jgi:transcriptional regulator with XRE-family HTH domain
MADGRDFGTLISERRLALGYSLGQLANRVRATASEVRAWERGDRAPDDDVVTKLAAELALDADELIAAAHDVERGAAAADIDDAEPTAVVMSPVVADAAPDGSEEGAEALADAGEPAADEGEGEAAPTEEPTGGDKEPTAQVTARADETPTGDASLEQDDDQQDEAPGVVGATDVSGEAERLADLPTEAVPVVAAPGAVAVEEMVAVQAPSHPVPAPPSQKAGAGTLDPVTSFLRVLFDPDRRYLFWVRTVLMFVVFIVFLRVLAWAVPAFFDTLRDILDTIESTTTDTTLPGG